MTTMPYDLTGFLGVWELDPAQAAYELGAPPARGRYALSYAGPHLHFDIDWTTASGQEMSTTVDAIPDGQDHPYADNPTFADTINYTLVDSQTLDSTAKLRGQITGYARRVLAPDGQSMTITQSGHGPDGRAYANRAVYRRVTA
jgi:hypothetical protein